MFQQLIKNAVDTEPLMRDIATEMEDQVEENFEKEGPRWKGLAESTIESRIEDKTWPGKILNRSGGRGLVGSITSKYTKSLARVGTNVKYAAIHEFGGKAGKGRKVKIPKRSFLNLKPGIIRRIKIKISRYLRKNT